MIILIFLISIGLIALGAWLVENFDFEFSGGATVIFGMVGAIVSFITLIVLCINVSSVKVINQKIDMYQIENTHIENQIAECVKQYQQYETEIFTEVTPESAITLVSLYPELKSDTLVVKQIEIYVANNEKIKELKETKINEPIYHWWLYFGKCKSET